MKCMFGTHKLGIYNTAAVSAESEDRGQNWHNVIHDHSICRCIKIITTIIIKALNGFAESLCNVVKTYRN